MHYLSSAWRRFFAPLLTIPSPEARYQARLIIAILIGMIITSLSIVPIVVLFNGTQGLEDAYAIPAVLTQTLIAIVLLELTRRGYRRFVAHALVISILTLSFLGGVAIANRDPESVPLVVLVVPVFIASLVFDLRVAIRYMVLALFLMLIQAWRIDGPGELDRAEYRAIGILLLTAAISIANAISRRHLEHERQEQLRRQEREFRILFEYAPIGMLRLDAQGHIQQVNAAFADTLGIPPKQLQGNQLSSYIETNADPLDDTLDGASIKRREVQLRRSDDKLLDAILLLEMLRDENNHPHEILVQVVDITQRKRQEQRLRNFAQELAATNHELDAFGHTIAHDLRNPLSTINGYVDILRMDVDNQTYDDMPDTLDQLSQVVENADQMIGQLLYLSRLRHAQATMRQVDVNQALVNARMRLAFELNSRTVQLDIQPDIPTVWGHAAWIEEIFTNLMSNSIKYMGVNNANPQIRIAGSQDDTHVMITVQDNGLGIAAEDQDRLYEMFTRFHQDQIKIEGFGLGLSIVKRLVDKMAGEIQVSSTIHQGTVFTLTFPTADHTPTREHDADTGQA